MLLLLACGSDPTLIDADCDGVSAVEDCDDHDDDRGLAATWYADADGDGFGDPASPYVGCAPRDGVVADATDCDDADATARPGGVEVCGGGDEDCDGAEDDADADVTGTSTWYTDADADGWGGDPVGQACVAEGTTAPGDCDDEDPDRYVGQGCRPASDCAHPDVEALAAVADLGVSDVLVDADCFAYLSTVLVYDEIQLVHPSGIEVATFPSWAAVTDLPALALDPDDGDIWVAGVTATNTAMVGRVVDGRVEQVVEGEYTLGSSWIGVYLNRDAQSIASDGVCVWVPNLLGDGTVSCVEEDGTTSILTTLPERAESVALAPDGTLHASSGGTIWALDSYGTATPRWVFAATVLDFIFDYDGSAYVETTDDTLWHVDADAASVFAAVSYDGKLTITPDGWLVRLMPYWTAGTADVASLWEEWPLP